VRKLFELPYVVCASPGYLDRAGTPRIPTDLLRHVCIAQISLEHDIANEWHFAKSHVRQKIKLEPKLRIQGIDALCEAGIAGCGIIRCSWRSVEDDIRSRKLVPVLPDWHCTGSTAMLMIYRKTRPMLPQVSVFVRYLAEAFRHQKSSVENALGISEVDNETQKGSESAKVVTEPIKPS
jgi:DNA-binding transcriptional LysR family regulator